MIDHSARISLLLPTRGRFALLQRLFDSIAVTTANLGELEIIMYIDEDDLPTHQITHPSLSLVKLIKPAGQKMGQMNQMCYEASHGRYLMLLNDDVVFRTVGWDVRLVDGFSRYTDEVALIYGNDLFQREALPTMPVVSRSVCEIIGGICPRDYLNTYIDLHLFDVFKKLAKLGHNRIVYFEDVVFEHMHHEAGKSAIDGTYIKNNERADDFLFITLEDDRWNQARTLGRYVEEKRQDPMEDDASAQAKKQLNRETMSRSAGFLRRWFAPLLSRDKI